MSSRDLFEDGDTGEAILRHGSASAEADKVNDKGAHADRDRSEAPPEVEDARVARVTPRAGNPLHEMPEARDATDTVPEWITEERFIAVFTNGVRWYSPMRYLAEHDLRHRPPGYVVSHIERETRRVTDWKLEP